jgi:hypothetical protein
VAETHEEGSLMGRRQALRRTKHTRVLERVNTHLRDRGILSSPGIHAYVQHTGAEGGNEYWFRTCANREGWWNPKTDQLRFEPQTPEIRELLYAGARMTCPGGRTASLCACQLFGMTDACAAYREAHPR